MALTPETRVLLTDGLRPPAGSRVEIAVGTTYSLNLTALLLAPLSFALFDQANADDIGAADPIRFLEAVRRHAVHTTVFCRPAGSIAFQLSCNSDFRRRLRLEVVPFHEGTMFHPKIWALRFIDQAGGQRHRVVVLSPNTTLDRSLDSAPVLDDRERRDRHAASRRISAKASRPGDPTRSTTIWSKNQGDGRPISSQLRKSLFLPS